MVMIIGSAICVPVTKNIVLINDLFDVVWEFQNRLNPRQDNIDQDVTEFRTTISKVLKTTTRDVLAEVENNARMILELETPARKGVDGLSSGDCPNNLRSLLRSVTNFTGFESSNCVEIFKKSLETKVQDGQDLIAGYDNVFNHVQLLVLQAFAGNNQFQNQDEIIRWLDTEYNDRVKTWERIRPKSFENNLRENIERLSTELKKCFKEVQDSVIHAFNLIRNRVQTCIAFEKSRAKFKRLPPLTLNDILILPEHKNLNKLAAY